MKSITSSCISVPERIGGRNFFCIGPFRWPGRGEPAVAQCFHSKSTVVELSAHWPVYGGLLAFAVVVVSSQASIPLS